MKPKTVLSLLKKPMSLPGTLMPPSNAALLLPPLKGALLPPLLPSSRGAPWSDVKYTIVFSSSPAHERNKQGFHGKRGERERRKLLQQHDWTQNNSAKVKRMPPPLPTLVRIQGNR